MKMKKLTLIIAVSMVVMLLASCSGKGAEAANIDAQPEISQIRAICNLATMECYYHNVAVIKKAKTDDGEWVIDWLKRDREMWIEYTGTVKLGIDISAVKMTTNGNTVEISIPDAEILGISLDDDSYNEDSYYASEDDWLFANKITAEMEAQAIDEAQEKMKEDVLNNKQLLANAQFRAQQLIKNYLYKLGGATGNKFKIVWKYSDGTTYTEVAEETTEPETVK